MIQLLWDASGLAKRYYEENGSETVDALFAVAHALTMAGTAVVLRRRFNRGDFDAKAFTTARNALRAEVFDASNFALLSVEDADVVNGIGLTDKHNLNTSDAAILCAFLRHIQSPDAAGLSYILIASDLRLLRAAASEGLLTLNPELTSAIDVSAFLDSVAP